MLVHTDAKIDPKIDPNHDTSPQSVLQIQMLEEWEALSLLV